MSLQNLLELDSFSQHSSLNEKDSEPPRPKPRPRTRVAKMASSSSSRKREKDVDEVVSFSSESGNDRKGLLHKSRHGMQKERGSVSTSAFQNNAFVSDEELNASKASDRSRDTPEKKRGILKHRQNSEDSGNRGRSSKKLTKGNLFSRERSSSLDEKNDEVRSGKMFKKEKNKETDDDDEEDDDDDARSDITYTVENETVSEKKSVKPPAPRLASNKRLSKIPRLRHKSDQKDLQKPPEKSSDHEDEKQKDEENVKSRKKKEDHLAVEIESEEDNNGEKSKDNVGHDESETVSVSSSAPIKDSVKSRFGKFFGASSERKRNAKNVDSKTAIDKESSEGASTPSSATVKEKSSFVNRWKSALRKGQTKTHENLNEETEEDAKVTEEDNADQENANVPPPGEEKGKPKTRKKASDTRIFMPNESARDDEEEEEVESSIKSFSSDEDKVQPVETPKRRRKEKTVETKKVDSKREEDKKILEEKFEDDSQTKKSSLGKLAKIWRGKSKSSEREVHSKDIEKGNDYDSDSDAGKKSEKEVLNLKSQKKVVDMKKKEVQKSKGRENVHVSRSSRKRDDVSVTVSESRSDSKSESASESEEETKKSTKKTPEPEPKRKKNVKRPSEAVQLTDSATGKDLLFGITVHQSDLLPLDPNVIHPVVKITAMYQNGQYMKRSSLAPAKSEHSKAEKKRSKKTKTVELDYTENVADSLLPIMSQPCQPRYSIPTFVPTWNELLVFEEHIKKFAVPNQAHDQEKEPILFFEVMDFLPMSNSGNSVSVTGFHGTDAGWYKIAWAFLKPIGANGVMNLNKKLRLQLYKPVKLRSRGKNPGPEVFSWWKSGRREKISSTLYVTPKGIIPPETRAASLRQLLSMRKEQLTQAILDSQLATKKKRERSFRQSVSDLRDMVNWSRMEGQSCKPPNKLIATLPASQIASLNIVISGNVHCTKFSPCGRKLAAGLDTDELHVILVFEVPSWTLLKSLKGHHGIIYDITWKIYDLNDDMSYHYLASASADSTVRVWKMENQDERTMALVKVLHHPSYVYSVKFHPTHPSIVATGCFDCIIRIWDFKPEHIEPIQKKRKKGLRQEITKNEVSPIILLDKHTSFVNCLMFDQGGQHLFSGDGTACIFKWGSTSVSQKKNWKLEKDVKLHHLDIPVNSIDLHPSGSRILVQLRDNFIKVLDVITFIPLQTFSGLSNERFQIRSCFSPCGNLVLSGSEDSTLCIWDADTGKILQFVAPRNHPHCIVTSVDYHPYDYYIALGVASAICEPSPILVYHYEAPVRMNYPMLKKSAMKFKSSLEKSRSQSRASMYNATEQSQSGPLPPKRGDSTEKFISIIHKLDAALYLAQQRNKKRNDETKISTCGSSTTTNIKAEKQSSSQIKGKDQVIVKNGSPKTNDISKIEKKLESSIHTQHQQHYFKKPLKGERPRSASSVTKEKRERFKKSRDLDEDRNFKSDSEIKQEAVRKEDQNSPKRSVDLDRDNLERPKPLKRRSQMQVSLEGNN